MKAVLLSPSRFFATLIAIMLLLPASAQWNTINHDATNNRSVSDIWFVGSTGYAVGWRADNVPWGTRAQFYKTINGGVNWTQNSLPLQFGSDSVVGLNSVQFLNTLHGFATAQCYTTDGSGGYYYGAVLETTDGGQTWTVNFSLKNQVNYTTGATIALHHIDFSTVNTAVLSGRQNTGTPAYNGVSYYTTNGGGSWTLSSSVFAGIQMNASDYGIGQHGSIVGGKSFALSGPYNGLIGYTANSGMTYSTAFTDPDYTYVDVHYPDSLTAYAVGDSMYFTTPGSSRGKLVKTTDGGQTWMPLAWFNNFMPLSVYFTDVNTGYIGGQTAAGNSGLLKTTDGGITWTPEAYPDIAGASNINCVTFASPNAGYASNTFTSSNSIYGNFTSVCGVSAGNDTMFCQQQGQLSAQPATPGTYTFSWSPATGLDDSTLQYPTVVSGVHNQQYIVTMTDASTSCVAYDTVIVSAYYFTNGDTTFICNNNNATLDLGPGASNYSWQWFTDINGNTTFLGQSTQTLTVNTPGTYTGFALFPGCGALTNVFTVADTCNIPCMIVSLNTIQMCGVPYNTAQFNPTVTPANPNLVYSWTPATGLSDPNILNPFVNDVFNVNYTLTVTDPVSGCVASDTANSAYVVTVYNDTIYSCSSQPVTLYAHHAAPQPWFTYNWSTGGNAPSISVSSPGVYTVQVQNIACFYTSTFTVIDSCNYPVPGVWPGDCNYDLAVNMADVLHIGLGYGATGAVRPNASNLFYAQPMVDWSQTYVNCNYKHGDADGNGVIDMNDTLPIALNYSLTHPYRLAPPEEQELQSAPTLKLVCNVDTVGLQTLVQVDVVLGTIPDPVDSLYGISFRITSESGLIDTNLTMINAGNSWLGNVGGNMFTFQKHFQTAAVVDFAEVKSNHVNTYNGQGTIASFFIVTTDNLSGIAICNFDLSDVTAVTESQTYVQVNIENDSVVIDPTAPAGIAEAQPLTFNVYPNPANDQINVITSSQTELIEICDMTGRVVKQVRSTGTATQVATDDLGAGAYLVRVTGGGTTTTKKLTITR